MSTPTATAPLKPLVDAIAAAGPLDLPASKLGALVRAAIKPGVLKDVLSGTPVGHAIHPLLTDIVIGSWTSATVLDLIGGSDSEVAAEKLVALGIAAYPVTALTGFTDWADSELSGDDIRRIGIVHAWINATALTLYIGSLRARRRGDHGRGVTLGLAGAGAMSFGGYLGGHLISRLGIGVDQTIFDPGDEEWTAALPADQLPASGAVAAQAGDAPVMLVRSEGGIAALHDRCSHRGCSLAGGDVSDGMVECPCHGSQFSLSDGSVLRGPATAPQPAFDARERDGVVEVRARG